MSEPQEVDIIGLGPNDMNALACAIESVADSITHGDCRTSQNGWEDDSGLSVRSLTEAAMGITAGLCRVAKSIEMLADAIASQKNETRVHYVQDRTSQGQ